MTVVAAIGEKEIRSDVVETAYELAGALDETLEVLHVIPEDDAEEHLRALRQIPEYENVSVETEQDRARDFAEKVVDETLGERDDRVQPVGRVGPPAETILEFTRAPDRDVRYLVIGRGTKSPVGKAIFGSTTQTLLLNADVPVVTVTVS